MVSHDTTAEKFTPEHNVINYFSDDSGDPKELFKVKQVHHFYIQYWFKIPFS